MRAKVLSKVEFWVILVLLCSVSFSAWAENKLVVKSPDGLADQLTIDDAGTVTAMGKLGVGTPAIAGIHLKGTSYPGNVVRADGDENTGGAGYVGYIIRKDGLLPRLNDRLGFLIFGTTTTDFPGYYHAAGFTANADADWTSSSTPAYFSFLTTQSGATTKSERLKITSAGNTQIFGGLQMSKNAASPAKPNCTTVSDRGTLWYTEGGSGAADVLYICIKNSSDVYSWKIVPLQ